MNLLHLSSTLFLKIQDATLPASVLALIILLLQIALRKKLTAAWRFALWIPVLIRLLVPVLPESSFSIFNAPRWFHFARPAIPQVTVEIKNNPTLAPSENLQLPTASAAAIIPEI